LEVFIVVVSEVFIASSAVSGLHWRICRQSIREH